MDYPVSTLDEMIERNEFDVSDPDIVRIVWKSALCRAVFLVNQYARDHAEINDSFESKAEAWDMQSATGYIVREVESMIDRTNGKNKRP
jgi:hypothetical protein